MEPTDFCNRLIRLGRRVRDRVRRAMLEAAPGIARPVRRSVADIQFRLDELAETGLREEIADAFVDVPRLRVLSEGMDLPSSLASTPNDGGWLLMLDPVDGTRGLMYDKRSAWCILALAPDREGVRLSDVQHACIVEIPTSRSELSDVFWADAQGGHGSWTEDLRSEERLPVRALAADAEDVRHGFGTVVRFCSGAATAIGLFEDDLWRRIFSNEPEASQEVYEDQYISNAGQFHALMTHRDRFVADLRPLFVTREGLPLVAAHPYDVGAALVARSKGVVLTSPTGEPLDVPLDLTSRVAWIGYGSERLRKIIEPHLQATLVEHGLLAED